MKNKAQSPNIMYKKLPVHWLFKDLPTHQVQCILIGNRPANGNFSYMQRWR